MPAKSFKILSIDTSCDDTCIALLEAKDFKFEILSNVVSSQVKLHAKYGGVYPSLAKREHIKNLPHVYKRVIQEAKIKPADIDAIGVTYGPGLEPCLWQGINFAQNLAKELKKQLIPVNHIEAHILANFLGHDLTSIKLPAICLVVSGGHTQLILMEKVGSYKILGETLDDAAGECFDKTARILGLGYPGGPAIAKIAAQFKAKVDRSRTFITLPRPMIQQKNYDFSFSGLKTAVLYNYRDKIEKVRNSEKYIQAMCFEIQQSIIDVLIKKTLKAAKDLRIKSIILGGGVAANQELKDQFGERVKKEIPDAEFYIPDPGFCTDNAAMVGVAAYSDYLRNRKKAWPSFEAQANLQI